MGFIFGQVGDEELLRVFFNPEGSSFFGGRCEDGIGYGEDFSLSFFCLVRAELVGLLLVQYFTKKHLLLIKR